MHAIKVGWVGQTFALAKCNDSGGRKRRIRRSKEERKSMVESFIKKFQKSNNGNFPSLNLTHKEVGGSFYTVRELVREIIQENRVLGPAKLILESSALEQYPLGSISMEPQTSLSSLSDSHEIIDVVLNHHQITDEEGVLNPSEQFSRSEVPLFEFDNVEVDGQRSEENKILNKLVVTAEIKGHNSYNDMNEDKSFSHTLSKPEFLGFDSGLHINGIGQDVEENKESDGNICGKDSVDQRVEVVEENKELNELVVVDSLYSHDKDITDNSFSGHTEQHPKFDGELPINGSIHAVEENKEPAEQMLGVPELQGRCDESGMKDLKTFKVKTDYITADIVVETFPLRPVSKTTHNLDKHLNEPVTESIKLKAECSDNVLDKKDLVLESSGLSYESAEEDVPGMLREKPVQVNANAVVNKGRSLLDSSGHFTSKDSVVLNNTGQEIEDLMSPATTVFVGTHTKNISNCVNVSTDDKVSDEATVTKSQHGNNQKESNTTLNRINLESWGGSSKQSGESESNPFVGLFKAFVSALVKFWTG